MRTLEERLTELSDSLFERTTAVAATDCIRSEPTILQSPTDRKRRRTSVAVFAALVVLTGIGVTHLLTHHDRNDVRFETAVPTSTAIPTTAPPTTTPTRNTLLPPGVDFNTLLPGCVLVDDKAGNTVGCALKAQVEGVAAPPPSSPGLPVYDYQGGTIVGYLVKGDGFVKAAVANDPIALNHLTDCIWQLGSGSLDGSPNLAGCSAALKAQGFTDPAADAHNARLRQERIANQHSGTLTR